MFNLYLLDISSNFAINTLRCSEKELLNFSIHFGASEDSRWEVSGINDLIAAWGDSGRFAPWASSISVAGVLIMVGGSAGSDVVVSLNIFKFWDLSKLENEDISDFFSNLVEVVVLSIVDDFSDIFVDVI